MSFVAERRTNVEIIFTGYVQVTFIFGIKETYPKAGVQEEMKGNYPPAFRSSDHFGKSSYVDLNRKILITGAKQAA
jgi:hypothetical protein